MVVMISPGTTMNSIKVPSSTPLVEASVWRLIRFWDGSSHPAGLESILQETVEPASNEETKCTSAICLNLRQSHCFER